MQAMALPSAPVTEMSGLNRVGGVPGDTTCISAVTVAAGHCLCAQRPMTLTALAW